MLGGFRNVGRCLDRPFGTNAFGKALLELPDQLLRILRQGLFKDVGPQIHSRLSAIDSL